MILYRFNSRNSSKNFQNTMVKSFHSVLNEKLFVQNVYNTYYTNLYYA